MWSHLAFHCRKLQNTPNMNVWEAQCLSEGLVTVSMVTLWTIHYSRIYAFCNNCIFRYEWPLLYLFLASHRGSKPTSAVQQGDPHCYGFIPNSQSSESLLLSKHQPGVQHRSRFRCVCGAQWECSWGQKHSLRSHCDCQSSQSYRSWTRDPALLW